MLSDVLLLPPDEPSPVVLHVPHSSRQIPPDIRVDLLLSDADLADELDEATDTATDQIALAALALVRHRPVTVINRLSRLVVDPERFSGGSEPAEQFGRGAVYTRTCSGAPLRREPYPRRSELLDRYFRPYAQAVTEAVADRLTVCGRAVVVDLHSYPLIASGFEDRLAPRPPLCIGTDELHTPPWLIAAVRHAFTGIGQVFENSPYSGCYVPLRYYGHDRRVSAVMIELRRDTYLIDPQTSTPDRIEALGNRLAALIDAVAEHGD
ncbi:N-formylglutamate deformylase [Rhodococcus sp. 27YEA15]|uniref:N-formylglutamate amidohydrolase n=1 Tax=Rhodococcus sp. 27YEA15 TaxID=3156259 RepID=UPI003C7E699D